MVVMEGLKDSYEWGFIAKHLYCCWIHKYWSFCCIEVEILEAEEVDMTVYVSISCGMNVIIDMNSRDLIVGETFRPI